MTWPPYKRSTYGGIKAEYERQHIKPRCQYLPLRDRAIFAERVRRCKSAVRRFKSRVMRENSSEPRASLYSNAASRRRHVADAELRAFI